MVLRWCCGVVVLWCCCGVGCGVNFDLIVVKHMALAAVLVVVLALVLVVTKRGTKPAFHQNHIQYFTYKIIWSLSKC